MSLANAANLVTQFGNVFNLLSANSQTALTAISTSLASDPNGALRSLWQIALSEISNPALLRQILNTCQLLGH
jgi:hypothetical protein